MPDTSDVVLKNGCASPDSGAADELEALRRVASHNMRLLKAQIVPLIDAALRSAGPVAADDAVAGHRARWTETALRLIDDTAIAAVAGADGGSVAPVDFRALLHQAGDWHDNRLGPVSLGEMPRLMARPRHMRLLADDLMTGMAWIAEHELPGGLRAGAGPRPDGSAVIWFRDGAAPPPDVGALSFPGPAPDERCWSVCRNLLRRMGGDFHLSRGGRGRLCLALRFPEDMVLAGEAG